ncbi:MAG: hypothetical protein M3N08_01830, partial [Pseudomonadota bacterium]|nr:hypothetical protein [Pseudomonadota bacterium]
MMRHRSLEIVTALALAAGELLGAGPASAKSLTKTHHARLAKSTVARIKLPQKVKTKPDVVTLPEDVAAKRVDLTTEPNYAVVLQGGQRTVISQSANFDPSTVRTAASHMKLLTAAAVLDQMKISPKFKKDNWKLLRKSLIHSDNGATEKMARNLAKALGRGHSDKDANAVLQAKAAFLDLSPRLHVTNASGNPGNSKTIHHDSFAEPEDIIKIAIYLAQNHRDILK